MISAKCLGVKDNNMKLLFSLMKQAHLWITLSRRPSVPAAGARRAARWARRRAGRRPPSGCSGAESSPWAWVYLELDLRYFPNSENG